MVFRRLRDGLASPPKSQLCQEPSLPCPDHRDDDFYVKLTFCLLWYISLDMVDGTLTVPKYDFGTLSYCRVRLQTPEMSPIPKINVTIFERLDEGVLGREVCSSGPYTSVPQGVATDTITLLPNQHGYLAVVSTLEPGVTGKFVLYAFSDRTLDITPGGGASTLSSSSIRSLSLSSAGSGSSSPSSLTGGSILHSPRLPPNAGSTAYANNRPSSRFRRNPGS